MKTYITLWFSSEGENPVVVVNELKEIGFEPVYGNYDMAYSWDKKPSIDDILYLADVVKKKLNGKGVLFKLETI